MLPETKIIVKGKGHCIRRHEGTEGRQICSFPHVTSVVEGVVGQLRAATAVLRTALCGRLDELLILCFLASQYKVE